MRVIVKSFWMLTVVTFVALALMLSLARLALPVLGEYKQDIELLLEKSFNQSLSIGEIHASVRGALPSLRLLNVSMLDKSTAESLLVFDEVHVDINIIKSLLNWRPELENLTILGLDLAIERNSEGKIIVAGVAGNAKRNLVDDQAELRRWFLTQESLQLEQATVRWSDNLEVAKEYVFTGLSFKVANKGAAVNVVGGGQFPGYLGGAFDFVFKFDAASLADKVLGEGYVGVHNVKLAPWQKRLLAGAEDYKLDGDVDLALWLGWADGHLTRADATVVGRDLFLGHTVTTFDELRLQAHWRASALGWNLRVDDLVLSKEGVEWFAVNEVSLDQLAQEGVRRFDLGIDTLDVAKVTALALHVPALSVEWRRILDATQPVASVRELYVRWQDNPVSNERQFFVRADVEGFGVNAYEKIPAVAGVNGSIYVSETGWLLDLYSENASIDFPRLFRKPINVAHLKGAVSGVYGDGSWRTWGDEIVFSNDHASASAYFSLEHELGRVSPELDLVVSVDRGDASHTSDYLPVGIMSEKVVEWLDRGIVSGRVKNAGITFRGPLAAFPFDDRSGRFEVQVAFEEGVVAYAPNWPPIVDARGQLTFNEQSMQVWGHSAMTLDSKLSKVSVSIPKFISKDSAVYIKGHAKGPTSNGLLFLTTTPLSTSVGRHFVGARAGGTSELDLSLRVPLNVHQTRVEIKGENKFINSSLLYADLGVDLSRVDGLLSFTDHDVSAERLRGEIFGLKVEASMHTEVLAEAHRVVVEGRGLAPPKVLLEQFKLPVFEGMQGDVPWSGRLVMPNEGDVELELSSLLNGVAIAVPPPIGKTAAQISNVQLKMKFPFNKRNLIHFKYGDDMRGVFELASESGELVLKRGELRYAQGEAQLHSGKGLAIVGRFGHYDHSQWMAYLSGLSQGGGSEVASLTQLDLFFDEAKIFGQTIRQMSIEMVGSPSGMLGVIAGPEVAGHFSIPSDSLAPLILDLDYVYFRSVETAETTPAELVDPRKLGALRLLVRTLYRNDVLLGRLELELTPDAGRGVNIKGLSLDGDYVLVHGHGSWSVLSELKDQQTKLIATVGTQNTGVLLGLFGYAKSIERGIANNQVNLLWGGGPGDFSLDRLDGELVFNIKSGALLDVNPGAGRIFGLLSVQALPRRLSLDFSDMLSKGLAFDEINGTFKLNKGEAFTEDLRLNSPAVEVSIIGYIDLVGKKYNQYVTVEPNYTGTLPLAVAVIVNPVAGVAAWFAERMLRRPMSDIAKILYHVTGDWEAPAVERLGRLDGQQRQGGLSEQP